MKWIKGKWDNTDDIIFVKPECITVIDTGRKLVWAMDCEVAVRYEDDQLPILLKLTGLTEEEAKDLNGNTNTNPKKGANK